jgi:hypothetical protein
MYRIMIKATRYIQTIEGHKGRHIGHSLAMPPLRDVMRGA